MCACIIFLYACLRVRRSKWINKWKLIIKTSTNRDHTHVYSRSYSPWLAWVLIECHQKTTPIKWDKMFPKVPETASCQAEELMGISIHSSMRFRVSSSQRSMRSGLQEGPKLACHHLSKHGPKKKKQPFWGMVKGNKLGDNYFGHGGKSSNCPTVHDSPTMKRTYQRLALSRMQPTTWASAKF